MLGVALCMGQTLPGSGRHTWMDARRKRGLTLAGKDWGQKKRVTEDEMVGWHQWLNGHESGRWWWTGSLACYSPRGCKELVTISDWTTSGINQGSVTWNVTSYRCTNPVSEAYWKSKFVLTEAFSKLPCRTNTGKKHLEASQSHLSKSPSSQRPCDEPSARGEGTAAAFRFLIIPHTNYHVNQLTTLIKHAMYRPLCLIQGKDSVSSPSLNQPDYKRQM